MVRAGLRAVARVMEPNIRITSHARERMARYDVDAALVAAALRAPDRVVAGRHGRLVAERALNDHVMRVVFEEAEGIRVVLTVYKARRARYEV